MKPIKNLFEEVLLGMLLLTIYVVVTLYRKCVP